MSVPTGYELTEQAKNGPYASYLNAGWTVDASDPSKMDPPPGSTQNPLRVAYPLIQQSAGSTASTDKLGTDQKADLQNRLDTQKSKELTRLDDILASRGISRSGAVGAGTAEIAKNYADALASGNVGIDKDMATLNLQTKQQDMMSKYYDAMIKQINQNTDTKAGASSSITKNVFLPTTDPFNVGGRTSNEAWKQQYPMTQTDFNNSGAGTNTTKKAVAYKTPAEKYQLYMEGGAYV